MAHVAGALAFGHVHVEPLAVDISDEEIAAIFLRPARAEVAHDTRVRVSAPHGVAAGVGRVRTFVARPMNVVAMLLDVLINEREDRLATARVAVSFVARGFLAADGKMLAALALDARSLDHVPEVRNHAHLGEELAVFVEVNAPWIAAAFGEDLEDVLGGMIPPDSRVHPLALAFGRARLADV